MRRITLFIIATTFTALSFAQNLNSLELCVLAEGKNSEEITGFFNRKDWKLDNSIPETESSFGRMIYSHKPSFGNKNSIVEVFLSNGSSFMVKFKNYNYEDYSPLFDSFDTKNFHIESLTIQGDIMISKYSIDKQEVTLFNRIDKKRSGRIKFSNGIVLDEPNIIVVAPKGYIK